MVFAKIIKGLLRPEIAFAHCDIPCGIYDPHLAQVAAHTVLRMDMLISQLDKNAADYNHKFSRYIAVKEEHAELCKHEIRIIWGDYIKPEHIQKHPELHDLVFKIMKAGSAARQNFTSESAKELLTNVNKFAEIFWETKGVKTARMKAPYPTEAEMVVPVP